MIRNGSLVFANLFIQILFQAPLFGMQEKTVYESDRRLDYFEFGSQYLKAASKSIAVLVDKKAIDTRIDAGYGIVYPTLSQKFRVCPEEKYASQPSFGYCTGFIIDDKYLITAGHCLRSETQCRNTAFLFGYNLPSESPNSIKPSRKSVLYCSNIVRHIIDPIQKLDYTIVKLNRSPKFRRPLKMEPSPNISEGSTLEILGHPTGLPLKYSRGPFLKQDHPHSFSAYIGSFVGNSGSPIFDPKSQKVIGMLTKGEKDFEFDGNCFRTKKCGLLSSCKPDEIMTLSDVFESFPSISGASNKK